VKAGLLGILFAVLIFVPVGPATMLTAQESNAAAKTSAQVTFKFERAGLPVPRYVLTVDDSGSGQYKATDGAQDIERTFTIANATTAKIFALLRGMRIEDKVCASKAKNIADTGAKTLIYGADGLTATCSYNYSENKDVAQLTEMFEGVAETLDEGRKLETLHRFDRLALDAEMKSYSEEVAAGRALEPGTIAECLRSIADDPEVIQRVRTQAARLLTVRP